MAPFAHVSALISAKRKKQRNVMSVTPCFMSTRAGKIEDGTSHASTSVEATSHASTSFEATTNNHQYELSFDTRVFSSENQQPENVFSAHFPPGRDTQHAKTSRHTREAVRDVDLVERIVDHGHQLEGSLKQH